jgi:hypothetical protein
VWAKNELTWSASHPTKDAPSPKVKERLEGAQLILPRGVLIIINPLILFLIKVIYLILRINFLYIIEKIERLERRIHFESATARNACDGSYRERIVNTSQ